jgi:acyl carrier protein phosphodiesterase
MNYLAHIYFSFDDGKKLVGNIMGDYVKGKQLLNYDPIIQDGIRLHRMLDSFTDQNNTLKMAKLFFRPTYRLYSGAFVDIVIDHFLAKELASTIDFENYIQKKYDALLSYSNEYPSNFLPFIQKMAAQNWLYNYQYKWGIEKSFMGLQRRAKYITETNTAFEIFNKNYDALEIICNAFIKEAKGVFK